MHKSVRAESLASASLEGARLSVCHAGFAMITVPIRFQGEFLGCVVGDGFILEDDSENQREGIERHLSRLGVSTGPDGLKVDELPVLTKSDLSYLTELIEMVVDEILLIQSSLRQAEKKAEELTIQLQKRVSFGNMVGRSAPMQELYKLVERVADSNATVLVQGENGTGKELIAQAIHYNSKRKNENFVVVNCAAFNDNLLESELFGHVKGAFTGAIKDKEGLFQLANEGTLFLDEIGETTLSMQVKLLRVLQDGSFTPVGGTKTLKSNARIVAATNRDILAMIEAKEFRQDLYFRLNVINLSVPALRDRREDIPLLVEHFIRDFSKSNGEAGTTVSKECLQELMNHSWPGNVRELQNEVERACVLVGEGGEIDVDLLSQGLRTSVDGNVVLLNQDGSLKKALEELEKKIIATGLDRTGWNKTRLAKDLGISRASLIAKVDKYNLKRRLLELFNAEPLIRSISCSSK